MSRRSEKRGGSHHIDPRSRGGGEGDNIFPDNRWPNGVSDHPRWHQLTENMKPKEVVKKIREYTDRDGRLKERFFEVRFMVSKPWKDKNIAPKIREIRVKARTKRKRKDAWQMLFANTNTREAVEWIEREFIRKEWLTKSS